MLKVIIENGLPYTIKVDGRIARITAHGVFAEFPWDDYYSRAELDALTEKEWMSVAHEYLSEAGHEVWSELLERWCPADKLDEWEADAEQEARWEQDHIRQESRADLFI